jgi:YjbE family integral membrane protein
MRDIFTTQALAALLQVVIIDMVLAGDNAVIIGLAAASLPPEHRKRAIIVGIVAATGLRILFAGIATQLLQVLGLVLAGGLLLLWVCWKMWRELRAASRARHRKRQASHHARGDGAASEPFPRKTFKQAVWQILLTDISLSLDNVLAVAGAAREHPFILAFGLLLSVPLMATGANLLARLLHSHPWIAYLGLAVVFYVACDMIYRGAYELTPLIGSVGLIRA